jgi:phosphotriesterase-related protein
MRLDAMKRFKDAGGGSLVDMNPIDCGRQIEMLRKISSESACTSSPVPLSARDLYYDNEHWVNKYALEDVARLIAEEVTEGIEINNYNGPIATRSKAKAGVIKFAIAL